MLDSWCFQIFLFLDSKSKDLSVQNKSSFLSNTSVLHCLFYFVISLSIDTFTTPASYSVDEDQKLVIETRCDHG